MCVQRSLFATEYLGIVLLDSHLGGTAITHAHPISKADRQELPTADLRDGRKRALNFVVQFGVGLPDRVGQTECRKGMGIGVDVELVHLFYWDGRGDKWNTPLWEFRKFGVMGKVLPSFLRSKRRHLLL